MATAGLGMILAARELSAQPISQDDTACPPPEPKPKVVNGIQNNHGHILVIPYEDVIQGTEKNYNIQGSSGHPHLLTIRAEDFGRLRTEFVIELESSEDFGHVHSIKIERQKVEG